MTHNDTKEAARLLIAADVPREKITGEALAIANRFIQELNRRLAQAVIEKFFPEWRQPKSAVENRD